MQNVLVLVVEDDPLIQLDLEQTLHDGGSSTECEGSGEKAIARLEANPEI